MMAALLAALPATLLVASIRSTQRAALLSRLGVPTGLGFAAPAERGEAPAERPEGAATAAVQEIHGEEEEAEEEEQQHASHSSAREAGGRQDGTQSRRFQVLLRAGARGLGETSARLGGTALARRLLLDRWQLQFQRRWRSKLRGTWQPSVSLELSPERRDGSLRWSRALLPKGGGADNTPDGTGLDLHLESSISQDLRRRQPLDFVEDEGGEAAPPMRQEAVLPKGLSWQQRAELVLGPRGQAKILNVTLPVGLLVGLVLGSGVDEGEEHAKTLLNRSSAGPLKLYARLHSPGLQELRGWAWAAELADRKLGLLRAEAQRPWRGRGGEWSLEHLRTHGVVPLPVAVSQARAAVSTALSHLWEGPSDPLRMRGAAAVKPSTRLRAGSDGGAAGLSLQSSEFSFGGGGWGASAEATRHGWGVKLQVAAGGSGSAWGSPQYTVTAQSLWQHAAQLVHEVKWMFSDGQGAWLSVRPVEGGGRPRVHLGMELR